MRIRDIQVSYVNGMMPDENDVKSVKTAIGEILFPSNALEKSRVYVHQNNSAESVRVIVDVALIILGIAILGHAVSEETKKKGDGLTRGGGVMGIACIIAGLFDYNEIQKDKNRIAEGLAGRVSEYLSTDPKRISILVLHSQGADIGYRAISSLGSYSDRIRVITLGAMTTIPANMCGQVTNFKFKNDLISRVGALPFEAVRILIDKQQRDISSLPCEGLLAHGALTYLKNEEVKKTMRAYAYNR